MNKGDDRAVEVFYNKCLRRILQIQWQDHVSTEELLERADMKPMSKEVKQRRPGVLNKCLDGEAPPRGPTPYPLL